MIHFRGARIREALEGLRTEKGDPHEGIQMEFVNPVTGRPVFPTLNYQAQLLRPGEATLPKRETSSTFIVVMDGNGKSEIGGQTFDWEPNDNHGGAELPVAAPHQHRQRRRRALQRDGCGAAEEYRPVPGARQRPGRARSCSWCSRARSHRGRPRGAVNDAWRAAKNTRTAPGGRW